MGILLLCTNVINFQNIYLLIYFTIIHHPALSPSDLEIATTAVQMVSGPETMIQKKKKKIDLM